MSFLQPLIDRYAAQKRPDVRMAILEAWRLTLDHCRARPVLELVGCGDNSCLIRKPGGMATNGGCRCEVRSLRFAVQALKGELDRVNALRPLELERARAEGAEDERYAAAEKSPATNRYTISDQGT